MLEDTFLFRVAPKKIRSMKYAEKLDEQNSEYSLVQEDREEIDDLNARAKSR